MLNFEHTNNKTPKKGDLLISEPFLPDPNFERTVIYICEHNEEGSFGFVLNRPSELKFDEIIEEVDVFDVTMYIGGPVQHDTLHFIHRASDIIDDGVIIKENLCWGGNFEQLKSLINTKEINEKDFRFFIGYSGWGAGQLQEELDANSWIVLSNATEKQIFDIAPEQLWRTILKDMGGRFKMYSNYPSDPRLN